MISRICRRKSIFLRVYGTTSGVQLMLFRAFNINGIADSKIDHYGSNNLKVTDKSNVGNENEIGDATQIANRSQIRIQTREDVNVQTSIAKSPLNDLELKLRDVFLSRKSYPRPIRQRLLKQLLKEANKETAENLQFTFLIEILYISARERLKIDLNRYSQLIRARNEKISNMYSFFRLLNSLAAFKITGDNEESQSTMELVSAIIPKVASITKTNLNFSARAIGLSFLGFQNLSCEQPKVLQLLSLVLSQVRTSKEIFSPHDIEAVLLGIRHMSCEYSEVRAVLAFLTDKIPSCSPSLPVHITISALNLATKTIATTTTILNEDTRYILSVLATEIIAYPDPIRMEDIVSCLRALQNLSSDVPEVQRLLSFLATKLDACEENLDDNQVGDCLLAVKNFSCQQEKVRIFLSSLAKKIAACPVTSFSLKTKRNAFLGLKNKNENRLEVSELLVALLSKMNDKELSSSSSSSSSSSLASNISSKSIEIDKIKQPLEASEASRDDFISKQESEKEERNILSMIPPNRVEMEVEIQRRIKTVFKSNSRVDMQKLVNDLVVDVPFRYLDVPLNVSCLAEVFHNSAKFRLILPASAFAVRLSQSVGRVSVISFWKLLYGLRDLSFQSDKELLDLISEILKKVQSFNDTLSAQAVGLSLYGLQNLRSEHSVVLQLLTALVPHIEKCNEEFKPQNVSLSLFGLNNMNSDHPEVCALLTALAPKIASCKETLGAQGVGNALYGLKSMRDDRKEVRTILAALIPKIEASTDILSAQAISNALLGLSRMHHDCKQVQQVLSILVPRIESCRDSFTAQNVGNSLLGLKNMSSDFAVVRSVLTALLPFVTSCNEELSAQYASNALFGLRNMSCLHPPVRHMLCALIPKIVACREEFTAQSVEYALCGLRNMDADHMEVRQVLSALIPKIENSSFPFSGRNISISLKGLQNMNSEHVEVRNVLSVLIPKIASVKEDLAAESIANCLHGLKNMSSRHAEVLKVVSKLTPKIRISRSSFDSKSLELSLLGLRGLSSEHPEVRALVAVLIPKMTSCEGQLTSFVASNILDALQGFSCEHEEVRALLVALTPKIEACSKYFMTDEVNRALKALGNMDVTGKHSEVVHLVSILEPRLKFLMSRKKTEHNFVKKK